MNDKGFISTQARKIYMDFVADSRIKRVAVIGSTDAQISIANFVLSFSGNTKKKLSWFPNEVEAKYWLEQ